MKGAGRKELTLQDKIDLVKAAIWRVETAKIAWKTAETDPTSDSDDRGAAKERFKSCEREFGWQWENVKEILEKGITAL